MFDMSIRPGDIRNQGRKLSDIAPKIGLFLALPKFWGRAFQKLYAHYHPCLAARRLEKFREDTPTNPNISEQRITAHVALKILRGNVGLIIQTVLGGLTINSLVSNFL